MAEVGNGFDPSLENNQKGPENQSNSIAAEVLKSVNRAVLTRLGYIETAQDQARWANHDIVIGSGKGGKRTKFKISPGKIPQDWKGHKFGGREIRLNIIVQLYGENVVSEGTGFKAAIAEVDEGSSDNTTPGNYHTIKGENFKGINIADDTGEIVKIPRNWLIPDWETDDFENPPKLPKKPRTSTPPDPSKPSTEDTHEPTPPASDLTSTGVDPLLDDELGGYRTQPEPAPTHEVPPANITESLGVDPLNVADDLETYRTATPTSVASAGSTTTPPEAALTPHVDLEPVPSPEPNPPLAPEPEPEPVPSPEPTPSPEPNPVNKTIKAKATVVSTLGDTAKKVTTTDRWGHTQTIDLEAKQVFQKQGEVFREMQKEEDVTKWNVKESMEGQPWFRKLGQKATVLLERVWKGSFAKLHDTKEFTHGVNLVAAAGIEGDFTAEALKAVDKLARTAIDTERRTTGQKISGFFRDLGSELSGREKDLHKKRVEITADLARQFNESPLNKNNPLYELMIADRQAREDLAGRVAEATDETLHAGEKKIVGIKLESGSDVHKFLANNIFKPAIVDGLVHPSDHAIDPLLRNNLDIQLREYFLTPEFQTWKGTLSEDQQKYLEDSVSYSTDILNQVESLIIPQALDIQSHGVGLDEIDFDIELSLGTAQLGPNGRIAEDSDFLSSREKGPTLNREAWKKVRARGAAATMGNDNMLSGIKRAYTLAALDSVGRNEGFAAVAGFLGVNIAKSLLRSASGVAAPITSGAMAGAAAGLKEYAGLRRKRSAVNIERALGYKRAENAKLYAEMEKQDYNMVEMGSRAQLLQGLTLEIGQPGVTVEKVLQLLGATADSNARVRLGDARNINLLAATSTKDASNNVSRSLYQSEMRLHDLARGVASNQLLNLLRTNDTIRNDVATRLGLTGITAENADTIIKGLTDTLQKNLLGSATISTQLAQTIGVTSVEQAQSVLGKDKAFEGWRRQKAVKKALVVGVTAGVMSGALQHFFGHHSDIETTKLETINQVVVDVHKPLHQEALIASFINPQTGAITPMHIYVPEGTHLEKIAHAANLDGRGSEIDTYSLVITSSKETVLQGLHVNADGTPVVDQGILDQLRNVHGTTGAIVTEAKPPISWVTENIIKGPELAPNPGVPTANMGENLRFGDLPGHEKGFWGWIENNLQGENNAQVNGVKHFIRAAGLYSNTEPHIVNTAGMKADGTPIYNRVLHYANTIWGKEWTTAPQSEDLNFRLPDFLSNAEGQQKAANLIKEAIEWKESGTVTHMSQESLNWLTAHPGQKLDEIYRVAYEAGKVGTEDRVPDESEWATILSYFGPSSTSVPVPPVDVVEKVAGSFTPHDVFISFNDNITAPTEVPHKLVGTLYDTLPIAFGYERGLESPLWAKKNKFIDRDSYYYGYDSAVNIGASKIEYDRKLSPRLLANKDANLSQIEEVQWYLSKLTPEENQLVTKFEQQSGSSLDPDTEIIVGIAAYKEEKNLLTCLQQYSAQVDKNNSKIGKKVTVVVYNNYTGNTAPDNSRAIIDTFKASNPGINVLYIENGYSAKAKMGKIRRDLDNYIMNLISKSGIDKDIFIASNDADVVHIDNRYLDNAITKFKSNPKLEAIGGKIDFPTSVYSKIPTLYAEQRAWQFLDSIIKHKMNSAIPELAGANTIVRASTLAAIGGYNPDSPLGEDLEIGWMIKNARNLRTEAIEYSNSLKIETDPRRAVLEWLKGNGVADRYGDFQNNPDVYDNNWQNLINTGIPYDKSQLESGLTRIYFNLYSWAKANDPTSFKSYFDRAMSYLGVKYIVENNKVVITDDSRLKEGLAKVATPNP